MKIVLATSNADKVREIKEFLKEYEIYALSKVCEPFDIVEDGASFKQNALIKARAVYARLCELNLSDEFIALSDDSGISVDILGGAPGIYSARYSDMNEHGEITGKNATDASNRAKLISELRAARDKKCKGETSCAGEIKNGSPAHYTACIAVASKFGEFSAHGFMHGLAIDEERGDNGFGYDFMFIPKGYERTIGELDAQTKLAISHRSKGLELIKFILKSLEKNFNRKRAKI